MFTDTRTYADVVREPVCPPAPMKLDRQNAMGPNEWKSIVRQLFRDSRGTKRKREE